MNKLKIPKIGCLYIDKEDKDEKTVYVYVGLYRPKFGTTDFFRFRPIGGGSKWLDCNTMFPSRFKLLG